MDRKITGALIALTNWAEEAKLEDFYRWYDKTHVPDIIKTGVYHTASRWENSNPQNGEGRFLALYETDREDPHAAYPECRNRLGDFSVPPQLQGVFTGAFKYIGPGEGIPHSPSASKQTRGLLTVFTQCTDPAREADYNKWYDTVHLPDVLETPGVTAGYRLVGVDGEDRKNVAVYEVPDEDVEGAYQRIRQTLGSKPKDHFIDFMKGSYMDFFRRIP